MISAFWAGAAHHPLCLFCRGPGTAATFEAGTVADVEVVSVACKVFDLKEDMPIAVEGMLR
jgi:hypothetical protein